MNYVILDALQARYIILCPGIVYSLVDVDRSFVANDMERTQRLSKSGVVVVVVTVN